MKVIDTRTGKVLPGKCIDILPAHRTVSPESMKRYYNLDRKSFHYALLSAPVPLERLVMQHGTDMERHFTIVTRYAFYELKEDDRPQPKDIEETV